MMVGIANRIQVPNKIVNPILRHANPHGEPMVRRRRSNSLSSFWNTISLRVFHFDVVPAFMQRFAQRIPRGGVTEREHFLTSFGAVAVATAPGLSR